MADQEKRTLLERLDGRADLGPVLRSAGWGLAAAAALAIAVIASRSEIGQRRTVIAMNPAQSEATRLATAQALTRADEAEHEVSRLKDTVQALSADRDKLLNRVTTIERSLEDLTGSIALTQPARRPAMDLLLAPAGRLDAAPLSPPPRIDAPTSLTPEEARETGGAPATNGIPLPRTDPRRRRQLAADAPAPSPRAPGMIAASEPEAPDAPASPLIPDADAHAPVHPGAAPGNAGERHGVDLGSATSIAGLRVLWNKLQQGRSAPLITELKPVVAVRDAAQPGSVELRLIAGPVPSAIAAARLCAALSAAGTPCRATTFDGQNLAAR